MDLSARARGYLLFRLLFFAFSDQGTDRAAGGLARAGLSRSRCPLVCCDSLLVRAFALLALIQFAHADDRYLDRPRRIHSCILQSLAATELLHLFRLFPFV